MFHRIVIAKTQTATANYWLTVLTEAGHEAVTCENTPAAVPETLHKYRPTVLLIEASFANFQGLELARHAKQTQPNIHCVVCLPTSTDYYLQAIELNSSGYLSNETAEKNEVLYCLERISQGYRYISPRFARILLLPPVHDVRWLQALTDRQKEILRLIAQGKTVRQIAIDLGVAESTIKTHKERLSQLAGLKSLAQLKILAGSIAHLL